MMTRVKGREQVKAFFRQLPEDIERKLLRGAGRAAAEVVAEEARREVRSSEVREGLSVSVRKRGDVIRARVFVKGQWANSVGIWLEYSTSPHEITVSRDTSGRFTPSLFIDGKPVGDSVFHTGAKAYPFMRVAFDRKEGEARAAAQSYINSRIGRGGIVGDAEGGDE